MRLLWKPIVFCSVIAIFGCFLEKDSILAQPISPSDLVPPSPTRPEVPPQFLPPIDQLLKPNSPQIQPNLEIPDANNTFVVQQFQVIGSTVFSADELYQNTKKRQQMI
ncbi:MAG: hypothetical protein ACK5RE_11705 [Pseudanabaena sp.]|jgi:hypothetical protein